MPRNRKKKSYIALAGLTSIALASAAWAQEKHYSPYVDRDYPVNVYFGDTHLHTRNSTDAYATKGLLTPDDAYRFARGQAVTGNLGEPMRLIRPLDFLVVSDHSEFMGFMSQLEAGNPDTVGSEHGRRWQGMLKRGEIVTLLKEFLAIPEDDSPIKEKDVYPATLKKSVWHQVANTADRFNQPGVFTAFSGYEWTSQPRGDNLHRVVIFADGSDKVARVVPFSASDSKDPADLWQFLADYEGATQGRVLAIPHNGNVSNGLMYRDKTYSGDSLTADYAETRARWEPLMEVTQIKGDGETHPSLSPTDEFADYENWDWANLIHSAPKEPWMLQYEYARSALKLGLEVEAKLGVNPFKYGMIGSSDTHTALAAVRENNFSGKFGITEPHKGRADSLSISKEENSTSPSVFASAGYAAVWATDNTREALFDAMLRKETYATTGPRMVVRFFGGWDFEEGEDLRPDYVDAGYHKGVPMGGDLAAAPKGKVPRFLIVASKDPEGANLDRVQVVKGWLGDDGKSREKVFNVAVSDAREITDNQVTPLATTVDIKTATYSNKIGAVQLSTVWQDPEFDAEQRAFYYLRVLEIPTPRWSTYDAAFYGTEIPKDVPAQQQERAYTSPIWYTP